jgi:hypothetical protein
MTCTARDREKNAMELGMSALQPFTVWLLGRSEDEVVIHDKLTPSFSVISSGRREWGLAERNGHS